MPPLKPKAILSPKDYRVYQWMLIATAYLLFVGGCWAVLGPINIARSQPGPFGFSTWFYAIPAALGLAATIGGIGIGRGNRPVARVLLWVGWVIVPIFPVGTVAGLIVICTFKRYFGCLAQIRAARARLSVEPDSEPEASPAG